ncbi:MAG: DUF2130 domain-containing protein [Thermoproteota archaeon]|nr:DUF2130 domain-containing protein [Thermoproteota archaeon]
MEVKCPICGSSLADDQFNLATQKLNERLAKLKTEHMKEEAKKSEDEKLELVKKHNAEVQLLESTRLTQLKSIEQQLKQSYEVQLQSIQKNYDESISRHSEQLRVLESRLTSSFEEQLRNKDSTIHTLQHQKEEFKKRVAEDIKATTQQQLEKLQNEILQRDIQLLRFQGEVESLKKQVSQTQAELKGEAGELDLYTKLTEAFPEDQFRRQTRGKSTGDIVHRIRTKTGIIDIPIVYDNKQAESVTPSDITKAKKYQEIHGTRYVIIVSSMLPKRDVKSGLLGDRDGIYLVHPSIVVPFAKYLRNAIVELSLISKSDKERDSKEALLYQYIRSQEFISRLEEVARIQTRIWQLQDKEEKDHQKLWKDRKDWYTQSERQYAELSMKIQSILSEQQHEIQSDNSKKSSLEIENLERRSNDKTPSA